MLARTHALTGAAAWLAAAPAVVDVDPASVVLGTGIAAGAALAPDLDHRSGTATHTWGPITRTLGGIIGTLTGGHRKGTHTLLAVPAAWLLVYAAVELAGGWPALLIVALCCALAFIACEDVIPGRWERYWPYNLVASLTAGTVAVVAGMDLSWLPWAVAAGWTAHIAGDLVTVGGVPVLLPFTSTRYRLTRARTGGGWETVTGWILTGAIATLAACTVLAAPEPWHTFWRDTPTTTTTTTERITP